jgi:predicted transcriptional regulator
MRSLRLDPDLEARLQEAAAVRGESLSEFIRQAVAERAETTLAVRAGLFDDVLGVVHAGGGRARRTGAAFTDVVAERSSRT